MLLAGQRLRSKCSSTIQLMNHIKNIKLTLLVDEQTIVY
jgi:hypothetical protein